MTDERNEYNEILFLRSRVVRNHNWWQCRCVTPQGYQYPHRKMTSKFCYSCSTESIGAEEAAEAAVKNRRLWEAPSVYKPFGLKPVGPNLRLRPMDYSEVASLTETDPFKRQLIYILLTHRFGEFKAAPLTGYRIARRTVQPEIVKDEKGNQCLFFRYKNGSEMFPVNCYIGRPTGLYVMAEIPENKP